MPACRPQRGQRAQLHRRTLACARCVDRRRALAQSLPQRDFVLRDTYHEGLRSKVPSVRAWLARRNTSLRSSAGSTGASASNSQRSSMSLHRPAQETPLAWATGDGGCASRTPRDCGLHEHGQGEGKSPASSVAQEPPAHQRGTIRSSLPTRRTSTRSAVSMACPPGFRW